MTYATHIEKMLRFNEQFVHKKGYEKYATGKFPNKQIAIVTCMDTRLTELLPAALNIKNGDVKIIKTAGALVSHPFGSVMRSLLVAIYELGATDIMVIGHSHCGMQRFDGERMTHKMLHRQIRPETIAMVRACGIDLTRWLHGFDDAKTSVRESVRLIRHHPLVPSDVNVYGFLMNVKTGKLGRVHPEADAA